MRLDDVITDLHCHILPGIDDGASDISVTKELLTEQKKQGVTQIAFTPHFWSFQKSPQEFLDDSLRAAEEVADLLDEMGITWSAGAEVRLTPEVLDMNMRKFCYVDTDYLLLEWPFTQQPLYGEDFVYKLLDQGITPVFAHIERYDYFWNHIEVLEDYINNGVLCQINSSALNNKLLRKQTIKYISEGYIHVLCSDTHNMDKRPPHLLRAYEVLEKELGRKYVDYFLDNANRIFHNQPIKTEIKKKKFRLFDK